MERTSAYIKTITLRPDEDFKDRFKSERLLMKFYRSIAKGRVEKGLKIKFRGRLGKDSPYRHLYKVGGPLHKYFSQDIRPEHAARFDVYVYGGE